MTQPMMQQEVLFRPFQPEDAEAFRTLNEAWIEEHFVLEDADREVLGDPEGEIISHGGAILMAVHSGRAIGCCALKPMADGSFEVAKMAIVKEFRGRGLGRRLLEAVVEMALQQGIRRLYLETNDSLRDAVRVYEKVGFRHLPPERIPPSPYARANVYMEMMLESEAAR